MMSDMELGADAVIELEVRSSEQELLAAAARAVTQGCDVRWLRPERAPVVLVVRIPAQVWSRASSIARFVLTSPDPAAKAPSET